MNGLIHSSGKVEKLSQVDPERKLEPLIFANSFIWDLGILQG